MNRYPSGRGRNYEILIRRAHNCERGKKFGAHSSVIEELLELERANTSAIRYRRKYFRAKLNIEKALYKLKKRKKYYNSQDEFMPLLLKLDKVKSIHELIDVSNKALAKVIECENRVRETA